MISLPSSPNGNLRFPLIVSVPFPSIPPPLPPPPPRPPGPVGDLEPNLSSGSQSKEARRSVHSLESFGWGGNLSVVFQFKLR